MCDMGLALGLAAGAAQAAGQASTNAANLKIEEQKARLADAADAREFIVKTDAANKEAYQAALEGDRAKSAAIAKGEGLAGPTAGLRVAEQSRQTALSIANAKDAKAGAQANYALGTAQTAGALASQRAALRTNPLTAFTDIATAGISSYGALRK
jgi:hypothetical protein